MYAAQMMFSSMLVVLPILVVLFLIYTGLLVYTFRLGRNDKNRSIGWRFVRLSLLVSILVGLPGLALGVLVGFICQGESMTYEALSISPKNMLLTGGLGLEFGILVGMIVSFMMVKDSATAPQAIEPAIASTTRLGNATPDRTADSGDLTVE